MKIGDKVIHVQDGSRGTITNTVREFFVVKWDSGITERWIRTEELKLANS